MEEDLNLFVNNNASQQKKQNKTKQKKIRDKKNKTVQHDTNKMTKLLD